MELKKILLVDDSVAFNYLSKIILKDHRIDCQVDEALDGKKALDYIQAASDCPDVIFLDINMPAMDGIEFLKKYDEQPKCHDHTRVFMLTSSSREEDRSSSMSYNFVKGFFEKPLTGEHIEQVLSTIGAN